MLLRRIVALSLLTLSTSALADAVDFNLSDSSVQLQYLSALGRDALGKTEFHVGLLYVDRNNLLSDFGVLVKDDVGSSLPGVSVGVGIKGLAAKVRGGNPANSTASAVALGAMIRYSPPGISRLGIVNQVYLSPNIVTFGDADRYVEIQVRGEFEVTPQAVVYLGYRKIGFGIKSQPYTVLDQGFNLGVRLSF
jgi:hypothetical protein